MSNLFINTFNEVVSCSYKEESFQVRDNGAIQRKSCHDGRSRKLDDVWTFGKKNEKTGYAVFGGDPVHRIVATAYHGPPPTSQHVVDHIDTNRMNNRPENLRWVTKLENILLNPVTCKRIVEAYGSIEEFFADPSKPKTNALDSRFDWMRTVSAEEAAVSKEKLERWADSTRSIKGGSLGEWLFTHRNLVVPLKLPEITPSLTEGALQADWLTPTKFPLCPNPNSGANVHDYADLLRFGETFSENQYGRSIVVEGRSDCKNNFAIVVCYIENAMVNHWGVTTIYEHEGKFVHLNLETFMVIEEAMETYCSSLNSAFDPTRSNIDLRPVFPTN